MTHPIPTKSLACGFELPVYGLGLWQMGGRESADTSRDEQEILAIRQAIDSGITHLDTAESYGAGHSEELLRRALEGYTRSSLFIASKVSAANQSYDGVRRACEASLQRIGSDYLDLYLLHRYPVPGIHVAETMRALDWLIGEKRVRFIGICNATPHRFKEAQKHSAHKLVCNQVHYNVQYREIETQGVLAQCQQLDTLLVAWRPLQKGQLPTAPILLELAAKYEKTVAQVALNWLISQEKVVTIAKTSTAAHLRENLGALGWKLQDQDIERIRREFPEQRTVSDAVPLNYPASLEP